MIEGPILLTGAGGDIGIALARVLHEALPTVEIHGADCNEAAAGAAFVSRFHALPRADTDDYIARVEALVRREGIKLVIPLAEAELARLLLDGFLGGTIAGANVISANPAAIATGLDKLETARTLAAAGIAVPECGLVGIDEPGDFDCIVKPRRGQGSKGLLRVPRADFARLSAHRTGDLWQRWLKDEAQEFTCGIVRFANLPTRSLSFRRVLQGGLTGRGEVVHDPRLTALCEKVAEALDLEGAINIQLRMDAGEPMIFEINPRFSSTVGFRHRLGFRDGLWAIRARAGLPPERYVPPPAGTRIERVAQEVIRPPIGL